MKKLILLLLFTMPAINGIAQAPYWEWARQAISPSYNSRSEGFGIATDRNENVYVTGFYWDTVSFGNYTLSCQNDGQINIHLVKYDSAGNILWAWSSGGNINGFGVSVATDNFGNVFLTAYARDTGYITFDNDTLYNNLIGSSILIAKFNSSGQVQWVHIVSGTDDSVPNQIATDASGNSYITGYFLSSSVTFGTHTINSLGHTTLFLVKYDSTGNVIWAQNAGGPFSYVSGNGLTTDYNGNIYIIGTNNGGVAFFGNLNINNSGNGDCFIAKYDSSGQILWVKNSTGPGSTCYGYGITADNFGNTYSTGYFIQAPVSFDSHTLSNNNNSGFFLVKYDSSGTAQWAKTDSAPTFAMGFSVITDTCGYIYVVGSIGGNTTFDTLNLQPPAGFIDPMFLVKYDSTGHAQFGYAFQSGGDDNSGIAIGFSGNIYITGDFMTNPFVIGNDTLNRTYGQELAFVAKLNNHPDCNIRTNINELSQIPSTTSLFPNPFSLSATLLINGEIKENSYLYIYNLLGQEVKAIPIINQNEITINRDNLADGMYFYKIITDKNETVTNGKFVVY